MGKSVVASAVALAAARSGLSVTLVRLSPLPDAPKPVKTMVISPDQALSGYLADQGLAGVTKRLSSSGAIDVVTAAAPGIRDLLVLGRIKQLVNKQESDLIVVDAPAAGHAIGFLRSPTGLLAATQTGPIAQQATDVLAMLSDGELCRVMLVTLAEATPVTECIETAFALEDELGIQLSPVIANNIIDAAGTDDAFFSEKKSDPVDELLDELISFRRSWFLQQQTQLARLQNEFPLPVLQLPKLFAPTMGEAEIELLAADLLLQLQSRSDLEL